MIKVGHIENWVDKLYIPALLKGLWVTVKHMITPFKNTTIQYPEYKWKPYPDYRGAHRLNKDEKGRIKCVACEMCASACPSQFPCLYRSQIRQLIPVVRGAHLCEQ